MHAPAPASPASRLTGVALLAALLGACGGGGSSPGTATASLLSVAIESSPFTGGLTANGTVTLDSPPGAAVAVALAGSGGTVRLPASVTVAAGERAATFQVTTAVVTTPTVATITASYAGRSRTASLTVAPPCDPATPLTVEVGGPASWTPVDPAAWSAACAVTFHAAGLGTGERLALLAVNADGPDAAAPSIDLSGPNPFAAAAGAPVASALQAVPAGAAAGATSDLAALDAGRELVVTRRQEAMAELRASGFLAGPGAAAPPRVLAAASCPAAPAVGSQRTFCVDKLTGAARAPEQRAATLRHVSAHALYYVTDDVWPSFPAALGSRYATLFTDLDDYFEGTSVGTRNVGLAKHIYPELQASFGPGTDVDRNCRVIFLLADLAKYQPASSTGIIVGFFDPNDMSPADAACTGSGSNGADMLYLMDPATFAQKGFSITTVLDEQLPGTMAHELQHDVIFNARCWSSHLASCDVLDDPAGDLWMNEGLAMVSEDLAGFGLNVASERGRVGKYLKVYPGFSLTSWPASASGDASGDYGGAHAFLRWLLDQAGGGCLPGGAGGCASTRALVGSALASRPAIASLTAVPFEEDYLRFTAGALFSGEPFSPVAPWGFAAGVPWSPLHERVGPAAFQPLSTTSSTAPTLRHDGWRAYVTGLGTGAGATLRVTSTAAVKPRLGVARFSGTLLQPP